MTQEQFDKQMKDFPERCCCPDKVALRAMINFSARMCLDHPELANVWYDGVPKVSMD